MEPSPGTVSARRLRRLNTPVRVAVRADATGLPRAVLLKGTRRTVEAVQEQWRVDEGWWRTQPVSRHYYRLVLAGGREVTVYRDLCEGGWWMQRY
jgi:hypothetical protein